MQSRWQDDEAPTDPFDQLIYMSRLVGADPSLVLWGGGNTSVKREETDFRGEPTNVMRVKGSGSDLKTIEARHFPGIRLSDLDPLLARDEMSDEAMVAYLEHTLLEPGSPRPSIETLLHGFLPYRSVVHSHADAVLSLTNTAAGAGPVLDALGEAVLTVPYHRPGFALSKEVFEAVQGRSDARGLVLMNHGLITWGDSARESYERHIAIVAEVEAYLEERGKSRVFSGASPLSASSRRALAAAIAPALRGALGRRKRVILQFDDSERVLSFLAHSNVSRLATIGAATPDHLLHTKQKPLVVTVEDAHGGDGDPVDAARQAVREGVERYVTEYEAYVERHRDESTPALDPNPRVILVPGVGMWTAGVDARRALVVGDIYHHTIDVIAGGEANGGYESLSERDTFEAEYWPLELYKLTKLPPEREFARHVALVTGGGSGIGRAIALRLAADGAHLVIADIDEAAAARVAAEVQPAGSAIGVRCDVTDEASVRAAFDAAASAFGGIDIVVSNAGIAVASAIADLQLADWERSFAVNARGHFLVSREAVRVLREQGTGGAIVFNATKNVTSPGRDFAAYSAAKAAEAQLARILAIEHGADGIRVNMVNPDAVFEGSRLWAGGILEGRAAAHGVSTEELQDFYRRRNLLQVPVRPEDVAEAVAFLASERSSRTTGAMLPVDGGVRDAFPR